MAPQDGCTGSLPAWPSVAALRSSLVAQTPAPQALRPAADSSQPWGCPLQTWHPRAQPGPPEASPAGLQPCQVLHLVDLGILKGELFLGSSQPDHKN